ncbi:MAG: DNA-binding protein, partial [Allomuricauda sp.]
DEKGLEVISERHQKDFKKEEENGVSENGAAGNFTDVDFDDI